MTTQGQFCSNCGAALPPGARFCDKCGQAVGTGATPPVRPSAPAYTPPRKRGFPWWTVILGVGCLGALCVGVVLLGGLAYFSDLNVVIPVGPAPSVPAPDVPAPDLPVQPTALPTKISEPTQTIPVPATVPPDSGPTLTGDQSVDDHSIYDDFSSDALGWPVFDDGKTILKYENQAYSFQITEPEYVDWAYFPVDFIPYEIRFDVQGPPGQQDGTFGVFCQFQDADNHYYVELNLQSNSYIIAQYLNGEDIPLTKQNTVGQFWYETDAFDSSPTSVNHIDITCYLDSITLYINEQKVDDVHVSQPFDNPGEAAFFVYAFSYAGPEGYTVFFDNVEAWQPIQ